MIYLFMFNQLGQIIYIHIICSMCNQLWSTCFVCNEKFNVGTFMSLQIFYGVWRAQLYIVYSMIFTFQHYFKIKIMKKKKKIELKEWKSDAILKYDRYGKNCKDTYYRKCSIKYICKLIYIVLWDQMTQAFKK
jgi:hypothetical protein